ncbi:MAG: hypothetical protein Q8N79_00185 [Candidatus Methanoperedens sp.]|nr:hypothetical protein [Candidatus Methanoperedens sp.]MDP2844477.1 hypothetical protein [Candidatus Methanoperedens sp.]
MANGGHVIINKRDFLMMQLDGNKSLIEWIYTNRLFKHKKHISDTL